MTPLEFLAEVLPAPGNGYYCACELTTRKKEHFYSKNLEDLQPVVDAWDKSDYNIYFALHTFENNESREADNARFVKALFLDLDGYATKKAAAQALGAFLEKTGLDQFGSPWVVGSGGGIHVYWPLTETVPKEVWKPIATNFKRLCKQEQMRIDMTVTADAARVLRYPGTRNHKQKYDKPRPVRILKTGDRFDLQAFGDHINGQLREEFKALKPAQLLGKRPTNAEHKSKVRLFNDSVTEFELLLDKTEKGAGCAQLQYYIDNADEDGMEPLWRGVLSWAKVCADGQEYAEWLSDLHPYTRERMHTKLAEIKGPYPCVKMDDENPGVCGSCPHKGKITNPLILGRKVVEDTEHKEITLGPVQTPLDEDEFEGHEEVADIPEPALVPTQTVVRPPAPRGFIYGKSGGVYIQKKDKDGNGEEFTKEIQVLPYDLFVVDILKQEDHIVHMVANRPDGAVNITLPQKAVVSKDETVKVLASQNIIASYGKNNDNNLFDYVRASVEEASLNKKAIVVPTQCGWQKDGSFVYNNRVFGADGSEVTIPMPGLENINNNTNGHGTLAGWRKFWNMMIAKKMFHMLALCLDSFGAPLMRWTEYDGFVWHIGSTQSGTGKSLTLSAKAGVWGHPVKFRTSKGTSPVAMQNRLGLLNSLPLLIDEITARQRKDMEWAPAFIFDVTEGQGKERMESGANKERLNNSVWASTCTMTSNTHLTDYMAGARAHSSYGELLRMLEWTPTEALVWTDEERGLLKYLQQNYGVAGEAWVRWLVCNQETVKRVMNTVHERLKKELAFVDDERYWHAACTQVVSAGVLLGSKYAGILDVPISHVVAALKDVVARNRKNLQGSTRSAEDVLNAYTREHYGAFIVVRREEKAILASWGNGDTVDKSITRSKVLGRVEHDMLRKNHIEYFIEEQLLRQHCVSMSYGYKDFKEHLEQTYDVSYGKKDMLSKTNGPSMRVNAMHISIRKDDAPPDLIPVGES